MKRKILFLDRDGTIISEPEDKQIDSLEKFALLPKVIPSLLNLQKHGFEFVMVTNQDGLGTSSYSSESFAMIQDLLMGILKSQGISIRDVLICPHYESDDCSCRKPKLGLLDKYLKDRTIDWERSFVVGDRDTDLDLADALDVKGVKIDPNDEACWDKTVAAIFEATRTVRLKRISNETNIEASLQLDGEGRIRVDTNIPFLNHLIEQLAKHSGVNLELQAKGDIEIDDHHTVEDVAILLGQAFKEALSDKIGIQRYGYCLPMDECRAEALVDLSGRSYAKIDIPFSRELLGELSSEMIPHFFHSFADSMNANLHLTVSSGNNHHMAESAFKATGRALAKALRFEPTGEIPSTKGFL